MKGNHIKLTLDQKVSYQIKVPGVLDAGWSDWDDQLKVEVENNRAGQPITVLTGTVDQAALHGILRRLYSLGMPLLSVICLDVS